MAARPSFSSSGPRGDGDRPGGHAALWPAGARTPGAHGRHAAAHASLPPASGLAAAEARPVDATMPVRIVSPGRPRAASSGRPPLWCSMDVRPVSTVPLIRITPLVHDRMSDLNKEMEGSSRCDRR
jgi:hypothetical protein